MLRRISPLELGIIILIIFMIAGVVAGINARNQPAEVRYGWLMPDYNAWRNLTKREDITFEEYVLLRRAGHLNCNQDR